LSLAVVGGVLLLARFVDALADPLIGHFADRTGGLRRRRWIVLSAPLLLLTAWLLLVPPITPSAAYLLVVSIAMYFAWSALTVPYLAYGLEISPDYHQRSRIASAREAFGLVGTVMALTLPLFWQDEAQPLRPLAIALLIALPCALIALWQLPEHPPLRRRAPLSLKRGSVILRRNRPFRLLLSAFFINSLANTLPATLFLLYVQHVLQADERAAGLCLLIYFGAALLGIPLWLKLAGKYGKHRIWRTTLLANAVLFTPALFLGPADLALFMAISALTGFFLGADLVLPSAMQADVVDADTATGGEARAGLYTALWTMTTKLAGAFTVGLALPLLDWLGLAILPLLYAGLPVLLKLVSARILATYQLDAVIQQGLQARISHRLQARSG
jgi:Na+/melibiose symporter-like transporter